jgi:hypothetical protein
MFHHMVVPHRCTAVGTWQGLLGDLPGGTGLKSMQPWLTRGIRVEQASDSQRALGLQNNLQNNPQLSAQLLQQLQYQALQGQVAAGLPNLAAGMPTLENLLAGPALQSLLAGQLAQGFQPMAAPNPADPGAHFWSPYCALLVLLCTVGPLCSRLRASCDFGPACYLWFWSLACNLDFLALQAICNFRPCRPCEISGLACHL